MIEWDNLIKTLLLVISTFLMPINGVFIAITAVISFDVLTHGLAAYHKGYSVLSDRIRTIIPKIILYNLTILCVYLMDLYLLSEFVNYFTDVKYFATKIVAISIFMIEFSSVLNNIEEIFGIKFLTLFRKWKKTIATEASDVKKITDDVADISQNIHNSGKDALSKNEYNIEIRGNRPLFDEDSDDSNMPI